MPKAPQFRSRKLALRDIVAGASGVPDAAFEWILEIEKKGKTLNDLADSGNFATLDAKLAAALSRTLPGIVAAGFLPALCQ